MRLEHADLASVSVALRTLRGVIRSGEDLPQIAAKEPEPTSPLLP